VAQTDGHVAVLACGPFVQPEPGIAVEQHRRLVVRRNIGLCPLQARALSSMSAAISCVLVVDPFAGVTEDVRDRLAGVPETERALLELRPSWPALGERESLIAARLRVFVLTWDPFGWMRDRGVAWATATGDGDSYEVVLYLMFHDAARRARDTARTIADVIGELAGSVLAVGAAHEELLVSASCGSSFLPCRPEARATNGLRTRRIDTGSETRHQPSS
jgi:hypothetical protein